VVGIDGEGLVGDGAQTDVDGLAGAALVDATGRVKCEDEPP
jgi:hypothetical protein